MVPGGGSNVQLKLEARVVLENLGYVVLLCGIVLLDTIRAKEEYQPCLYCPNTP